MRKFKANLIKKVILCLSVLFFYQIALTAPYAPGHAKEKESKVYVSDIKEGVIGVSAENPFDNPADNVFRVVLTALPTTRSMVWLTYDLLGVQDNSAVSRSINDGPSQGGYLVKVSGSWHREKERIALSCLRAGVNTIRFTVPPNAGYSYRVRNISLLVEQEDNRVIIPENNRALIITTPENAVFYGQQGYIKGFLEGRENTIAKIFVDGNQVINNGGAFEYVAGKKGAKTGNWEVVVEAVYPGGEKLKKTVGFHGELTPDYVNVFTPFHAEKAEKWVGSRAATIKLGTVSLHFPDAALSAAKLVSVTPLRYVDIPALDQGLINVTATSTGYRFLPHGSRFEKAVTISMGYDESKIPEGYTAKDIVTYYFDDREKHWLPLEKDSVDVLNKRIISRTLHFTDMINGVLKAPTSPETEALVPTSMSGITMADPSTEIEMMEPPVANALGTASLSYPVKLPGGRNGMEPDLSIDYNSENDNGWMGMGWNLKIPAVTIETRWGVPRYDNKLETETYTMGGEQFFPVAHRGEPISRVAEKQFYLRVEGSFEKIIRHGSDPKNYWWEITGKDGTRHFYGGSPETGPDENAVLKDGRGNIAYWALTEERDANDNFIEYHYDKVTYEENAPGKGGYDLYIASITYTGHGASEGKYRVLFSHDQLIGQAKRPDITINARLGFKRVTADLLKKITVQFNGQPVRSYELKYKTGEFYKTLLDSIAEYDAAGNFFYAHGFNYYDDVRDTGTNKLNVLEKKETESLSSDNIKAGFLNPVDVFGDNPSLLSGNKSIGGGFGLAVTIGPDDEDYALKSNTAGVTFGFNYIKNEGMVALVDINGDGLVDKVYKKNGKLSYRPNKTVLGGALTFGDPVDITGISDFNSGETFSGDIGVESNFEFYAGFEYTRTQDITSTYFTDANGDMLMDIVNDGTVYFNHIDSQGHINFSPSSENTPSPIKASSKLDPDLVKVDTAELRKLADENPLHDVVKLWQAPFDGVISITQPVSLIKDLAADAKQQAAADGVRVAIQKNAAELWSVDIDSADFSPKVPVGVGAVQVKKGDHIYFRVQSKFNGASDQVLWSPEITYTNQNAALKDANGLPVYRFNAQNDFLLSSSVGVGMPINGKIHIEGNFIKPALTDGVVIRIEKKSNSVRTTIFEKSFTGDQVADFPVSLDADVVKGDVFFFIISSPTNVDWASIGWSPHMYYSASEGGTIPVYDNTTKQYLFNFYPTPDFQSFNTTLKPGLSWIVPVDDTFTITPQISLPLINQFTLFPNNGTIVFSVKKQNRLVKEETIPVHFGIIGAHPSFSLILKKDEEIFFDYHVDSSDLAGAIDTKVRVDTNGVKITNANYGLSTLDRTFIFGPLYRHWGQFIYNGNEDRETQPIDESKLKLNASLTTDKPEAVNLSNITYMGSNLTAKDSADQMKSYYYDTKKGYDPTKDIFVYMYPNSKNKSWTGYDSLTYVVNTGISSSRMGRDNLLAVNPAMNSGAAAMGAVGINKVSNTNNYSFAAGLGPLGGSGSFGNTSFVYDYMDINGDRFPDILSPNKIQFTTAYGGLEPKARDTFSFSEISGSDHFSVGGGLGGSFTKSNAPNNRSTSKGVKAARAESQTSTAAGLGVNASLNYNEDESAYAFMDINGDDLPDRVYKDGNVELNIGYSFLPKENWGFSGISKGSALSVAGGITINIDDYSIAGGLGLTRTDNKTSRALYDVNGDGLLDFITDVTSGGIKVKLNTGNGFSAAMDWGEKTAYYQNVSTGESINGAFTIGIPIIPIAPVVKLCINPSFNISQGADRSTVQLDDINGDGYPDYLESENENTISYALSTIKRTNKLSRVNRPMGAYFTLDYKRVGNTYDMPNSVWTLSDLKIYDGVPGDGADTMHNTFEYDKGFYDRNEREFYGFGKVITASHNTEKSDEVYRKAEEEFSTDNFYEKGLLISEVLKDAEGNKFTESVNTYEVKDIFSGQTLAASDKQSDFGAGFPALTASRELFYEGQSAPGKSTSMAYEYDVTGNLTSYTDFGDPGPGDDVTSSITYHTLTDKYILNIPKTITVKSNGKVYRKRSSLVNNNGDITELSQYIESGTAARYNMDYDNYGNLTGITRPGNATGQRLTFNYEFDPEVQTYITKTTDSYGYTSTATYDFRFGEFLSKTDINGQQTKQTIDDAGRALTYTGPLEIASGQPFTIAFEYHPGAKVPWALTKHFDPAHPDNFIETATFNDGLGREIQTKKDGALFINAQTDDEEVLLVSGKNTYDAFGRILSSYHPVTEPKTNLGIYNDSADAIAPTTFTYDVLDRVLSTTRPDKSVNKFEYDFGEDREGITQFKTKVTDGNNISFERFTNVKQLTAAVKQQYRQGKDVWTSYTYDPVDELITVTDDVGNTIVNDFDWLGRKTKVLHPDAGLTAFEYDLNDNPTEIITANLKGGPGIKYTYDKERLIKVSYPKNPQNNITLIYGEPGAAFNRAGRVVKQQDATGSQDFFYDPLGEEIKNVRIINVPDTLPLTYTTEWTYDTWNRLTAMIYPDGERLTYTYNEGGLLQSLSGIKGGTTYNYLPKMGYDKFESEVYRRYGNGTEMTNAYEPERRRLKNHTAKTAAGRLVMDNAYAYDKENNIVDIANDAPVPPANLMGGTSDYQYTYDDLYRLTNASGKYSGSTHEHRYNLALSYNSIYNILSKKQVHERKGYDEPDWTVRNQTTYTNAYDYNTDTKPHAPVHIGRQAFTYDANGNQTGWNDEVNAQNRQIEWDEENRIKSIADNGEIFRYIYDGSGQRVLKSNGGDQAVSVNGKKVNQKAGLGNYTIYVNPFMVVRSGGFTKHFYIEGERIVSKLGESGKNTGGNGKGGGGNGNNQEAFQFYYQPDHLGNTSFITDRAGEVYQHLEYFPFGETFIDEHSNTWRTPYLYNGKELDEETGLYYYGARYYDPKTSVWESVDPLANIYPGISPYAYTAANPIRFTDPDGLNPDDPYESDDDDDFEGVNTHGLPAFTKEKHIGPLKSYNTALSVAQLESDARSIHATATKGQLPQYASALTVVVFQAIDKDGKYRRFISTNQKGKVSLKVRSVNLVKTRGYAPVEAPVGHGEEQMYQYLDKHRTQLKYISHGCDKAMCRQCEAGSVVMFGVKRAKAGHSGKRTGKFTATYRLNVKLKSAASKKRTSETMKNYTSKGDLKPKRVKIAGHDD